MAVTDKTFGIDEPVTRTKFWELHDELVRKNASREDHYALHRAYWGAYVRAYKVPVRESLVAACRAAMAAGDAYLNSPYTHLQRDWDTQTAALPRSPLYRALYANGEGLSASVNTCLLKEAMRQHIERREPN